MISPEQEHALASLWYDHQHDPMAKFCNHVQHWDDEARKIAKGLGLDTGPPQRIVDLGCGFGYFIRICREWGHNAIGVDRPNPLIDNATTVLEVPCVLHEIHEYEPLPESICDCDLVTTFGVNFRLGGRSAYWHTLEYDYLLAGIMCRLVAGGSWILRPNQTTEPGSIANLLDPEWWGRVCDGAYPIQVNNGQVTITNTRDQTNGNDRRVHTDVAEPSKTA